MKHVLGHRVHSIRILLDSRSVKWTGKQFEKVVDGYSDRPTPHDTGWILFTQEVPSGSDEIVEYR
jgi:hypothetical protein